MTIETPNAENLKSLNVGDVVKVNGQKTAYTVNFVSDNFIGMSGPRGGQASLVPSICGKSVQLSKGLGTSNKRDWVTLLAVA